MKKFLIPILIVVVVGGLDILGIKTFEKLFSSIKLPSIEVPLVGIITTPTTETVTGPVILQAIHNQSRLETVSMVLANDQDISKVWGFEGACRESLTYLGYYTVTAGIDLNDVAGTNIILDGSGVPAETTVTLTLPPARILHVEPDMQNSRIVHSSPSIISQLCGSRMPAMVVEAQTNLQKVAEASALKQGIIKMAQDRASFELQKILLPLGFTNVNVEFNEAYDDQPN